MFLGQAGAYPKLHQDGIFGQFSGSAEGRHPWESRDLHSYAKKKKKKAHGVMAPVITPGLVAMPWAALPIINSLSFGGQLLQFLFFSGSQASDFHVFTAKKDFTFAPASAAPLELELQEGMNC